MIQSRRKWDLHPTEAYWFAVRTPALWEKKIAARLAAKDIEVYLPLLTKWVQYKKQAKKKVEKPLITGFVFVKIVEAEYAKVIETEGVAFFLKDAGILRAIPKEEIDWLRVVVGEDVLVQDAKFEAGQRVEIISGPYMGRQGRLVEGRGNHRFVVNLFFLEKEMILDIPKRLLRVL